MQGATVIFSKISDAYEVLSNPIHRGFYDMVIGVTEQTEEELERLSNMKKKDALIQLKNMNETVERIRVIEQQKKGLIILDARYGDMYHPENKKGTVNQYDDVC